MNKSIFYFFIIIFFNSCSHKKQLVYVENLETGDLSKINFNISNNIEVGDVLKIEINTAIPEASIPYNSIEKTSVRSAEFMIIDGYNVGKDSLIDYPILGEINVVGYSTNELSNIIGKMLIDLGHLTNPHVKVNKINSKFTVLGEVGNPGTFFNYENQLNIFQALGFAGDLMITARKKNIKLIREENGLRKTYKFTLNSSNIFDKPYYYIKSNDVIIVEPNFAKIKSAGFIGSPASIASISSILLSITLLLINK